MEVLKGRQGVALTPPQPKAALPPSTVHQEDRESSAHLSLAAAMLLPGHYVWAEAAMYRATHGVLMAPPLDPAGVGEGQTRACHLLPCMHMHLY